MTFTVRYHPSVKGDLTVMDKALKERIRKAIETRLTSDPALFGKPLRGTLAGYWKLLVGDWRVLFDIHGAEVFVLAIKHRSRIYDEIEGRL